MPLPVRADSGLGLDGDGDGQAGFRADDTGDVSAAREVVGEQNVAGAEMADFAVARFDFGLALEGYDVLRRGAVCQSWTRPTGWLRKVTPVAFWLKAIAPGSAGFDGSKGVSISSNLDRPWASA